MDVSIKFKAFKDLEWRRYIHTGTRGSLLVLNVWWYQMKVVCFITQFGLTKRSPHAIDTEARSIHPVADASILAWIGIAQG